MSLENKYDAFEANKEEFMNIYNFLTVRVDKESVLITFAYETIEYTFIFYFVTQRTQFFSRNDDLYVFYNYEGFVSRMKQVQDYISHCIEEAELMD